MAVFERETRPGDERAQVGIGTLIVFIAMVLVAAIAAGVLINTAGFLQTKSQQTGEESSAQVSNRVNVVSAYANVANEEVDYVNLTVMRGAGSDDINLAAATIEWIGPNNATTLLEGSRADVVGDTKGGESSDVDTDTDGDDKLDADREDNFAVEKVKNDDTDIAVLNEQSDRAKIILNMTEISGTVDDGASPAEDEDGVRLQEGQKVQIKITTQYGAVTLTRITIPQSLSGDQAVTV